MSVRLLVTDIDGTLVLDDQRPALPRGLSAFLERFVAGGGRWVIATGRDLADVESLLPVFGASVRPEALVVNDGAIHGVEAWAAWNEQRRVRREELFARFAPSLVPFRDACRRDGAQIWQPVDAPWGLDAPPALQSRFSARFAEAFSHVPELVLAGNGRWAAPAPRGDDKGAAVRALAGSWGIAPSETVVAGDDLNDLPMMEPMVSTRWIAPANAVPRVLERVAGRGFVATRAGALGVWEGLRRAIAADSTA